MPKSLGQGKDDGKHRVFPDLMLTGGETRIEVRSQMVGRGHRLNGGSAGVLAPTWAKARAGVCGAGAGAPLRGVEGTPGEAPRRRGERGIHRKMNRRDMDGGVLTWIRFGMEKGHS